MDGWCYPTLMCIHRLFGAAYGFPDYMQIPGYVLRVGCEENCWHPLKAFFNDVLPLESFHRDFPSRTITT